MIAGQAMASYSLAATPNKTREEFVQVAPDYGIDEQNVPAQLLVYNQLTAKFAWLCAGLYVLQVSGCKSLTLACSLILALSVFRLFFSMHLMTYRTSFAQKQRQLGRIKSAV